MKLPGASGRRARRRGGQRNVTYDGGGLDITIVIPVRNEERTLPALLGSIEAQTYQPTSVLFVDGDSTDGTVRMLRSRCAGHPGWRVLNARATSPGGGRNAGIGAAETEWVALTDAGIELDAHWLERLVRVVDADPTVDIVYGHYEPSPGGYFRACAALAYVGAPVRTGQGPVRTRSVASCLMRRSLWERVGGFPDLRAAEDLLFMRRVDELGARVAVAPEAVVYWELQPNLARTFRRFRVYSKVNVEIGEQRSWHYGVARMYLAATPFLLLGARRRTRWLAAPLLGVLARAGRSVWVRREGRGVLWAADPGRVATVAAILLVVDAATFAGWADAIIERRRRN